MVKRGQREKPSLLRAGGGLRLQCLGTRGKERPQDHPHPHPPPARDAVRNRAGVDDCRISEYPETPSLPAFRNIPDAEASSEGTRPTVPEQRCPLPGGEDLLKHSTYFSLHSVFLTRQDGPFGLYRDRARLEGQSHLRPRL